MDLSQVLAMLSLLVLSSACAGQESTGKKEAIVAARESVSIAGAYFGASPTLDDGKREVEFGLAWDECSRLYSDSAYRLRRLVSGRRRSLAEAKAWISGAATCHRTCTDGLREKGMAAPPLLMSNVTRLLTAALKILHERHESEPFRKPKETNLTSFDGMLDAWVPDIVVAKDGSSGYRTINDALATLARQRRSPNQRRVIYVKAGIYVENVEIDRTLRNLMFVGDGIDKTTVTGSRSVPDGYTTYGSATFGVAGDGFWARDMTFENTAGPGKHQAVALRVASDLAVFYRCSFRGYQDTLFVHSQRQFYRDCDVYGTIDFVFGNAAAALQNCNIYVRKPMEHQANMVTAQGRDSEYETTGTVVHSSRVLPSSEFEGVKRGFSSFLGRPWKKYARVVVMETELDGLVNGRGWAPWVGDSAPDTVFYGEYMNTGDGANTGGRVRWAGFHVMKDAGEAIPFTVGAFLQGDAWIPASGVPFLSGL
ncbi:plant invertase/pectin methylesterase inhibitor superfamily [Wolffia australiana]